MIRHDAHVLSQDVPNALGVSTLLERLDLERLGISSRLAAEPKRRADLGQFFTPATVARFMAAMLGVPNPPEELRILDAGGGSGILTAAAIAELCGRPKARRPQSVRATIWEIDELLAEDLDRTFEYCRAVCCDAGVTFTGELHQENFILSMSTTGFQIRSANAVPLRSFLTRISSVAPASLTPPCPNA